MNSQDFLYYSLGLGFLILVGFFSFVAYQLALTLKSLRNTFHHIETIAENIDDVANDLSLLKDKLKLGYFSLISAVLRTVFRRKRGGE